MLCTTCLVALASNDILLLCRRRKSSGSKAYNPLPLQEPPYFLQASVRKLIGNELALSLSASHLTRSNAAAPDACSSFGCAVAVNSLLILYSFARFRWHHISQAS